MFMPTVAVRMFRPVATALEARGIASEPFFAVCNMPPPESVGWDIRASLRQVGGMWHRFEEITGDRFCALKAAENIDLTTCDVITYLEANAKTVREALQKKFEYLPLLTDMIVWTLDEIGDEALLTLRATPPRPPHAPSAEYVVTLRHAFFRRFGPPGWQLRTVRFQHEAPEDTSEYRRIFGVTPQFNAAEDQLVFDVALLDGPMRTRDEALCELLGRYAKDARAMVPSAHTMSERVREALREGHDPGIEATANRLAVSVRSLQRTLASERTSYAEISSAVRRSAAERLLRQRELAISEIAYALGFSDVPAFHKAFRRWTGATPGDFRTSVFGQSYREPSYGRLRDRIDAAERESTAANSTGAQQGDGLGT